MNGWFSGRYLSTESLEVVVADPASVADAAIEELSGFGRTPPARGRVRNGGAARLIPTLDSYAIFPRGGEHEMRALPPGCLAPLHVLRRWYQRL
jgi:hypothetical protein